MKKSLFEQIFLVLELELDFVSHRIGQSFHILFSFQIYQRFDKIMNEVIIFSSFFQNIALHLIRFKNILFQFSHSKQFLESEKRSHSMTFRVIIKKYFLMNYFFDNFVSRKLS